MSLQPTKLSQEAVLKSATPPVGAYTGSPSSAENENDEQPGFSALIDASVRQEIEIINKSMRIDLPIESALEWSGSDSDAEFVYYPEGNRGFRMATKLLASVSDNSRFQAFHSFLMRKSWNKLDGQTATIEMTTALFQFTLELNFVEFTELKSLLRLAFPKVAFCAVDEKSYTRRINDVDDDVYAKRDCFSIYLKPIGVGGMMTGYEAYPAEEEVILARFPLTYFRDPHMVSRLPPSGIVAVTGKPDRFLAFKPALDDNPIGFQCEALGLIGWLSNKDLGMLNFIRVEFDNRLVACLYMNEYTNDAVTSVIAEMFPDCSFSHTVATFYSHVTYFVKLRPLLVGGNKKKMKGPQKRPPQMKPRGNPIKGHGDYSANENQRVFNRKVKNTIRKITSTIGRIAGGAIGFEEEGRKFGRMVGNGISHVTGHGDYRANGGGIKSNSLFTGNVTGIPSFGTLGTVVRHAEYIQDIKSPLTPATFNVTSFSVNPGISTLFPWLSNVANTYEACKWNGLVFYYKSTCSNYSATSALGSVILAAEYNSDNPVFVSRSQMENSAYALSGRPDECLCYGIECAGNANNLYFIRNGKSNLPLTTTDLCTMHIGSQLSSNFAASSPMGELHVAYDIVLERPRLGYQSQGFWRANVRQQMPAVASLTNVWATLTNTVSGSGTLSNVTWGDGGSGNSVVSLTGLRPGTQLLVNLYSRSSANTSVAGQMTLHTTTEVGLTGINVFRNNSYYYGEIFSAQVGNTTAIYKVTADVGGTCVFYIKPFETFATVHTYEATVLITDLGVGGPTI